MTRPTSSPSIRERASVSLALAGVTDAQLLAEVSRRNVLRCPCGKWPAYVGIYDADGMTLRCRGCLKAIAKCSCSRTEGYSA